MSGLYENLPFPRGGTWGTTDTTVRPDLEGKEFIVQDTYYGTGYMVKLRVCRNNSGIALVGKRAAKFNLTAGKGLTDVAGYCTVAGEKTAIIDDRLPASGAPSGDLFYCVVEGPVLVKSGSAASVANSIAVGDYLQALTAATTGATTAGRVGEADLTGATSVLAGNIFGVIGVAMSALTTSQTNADLLMNANSLFW